MPHSRVPRSPNALKPSIFTSLMRFAEKNIRGLSYWSDGLTAGDGLLYPTGLNTTAGIGSINSFAATEAGNAQSYAPTGIDDYSMAQNSFKYKVLENFFNRIERFKGMKLFAHLPNAQQRTTSAQTGYVNKWVALDSTHVFIIFSDGSSTIKTVVGLIAADGTMTFGSVVNMTTSGQTGGTRDGMDVAVIGTNKVVCAYRKASGNYGEATVCTVSGVTITAGTPAGFDTNATLGYNVRVCKLNTDKFLINWVPNSGAPKYIAATVATTTITFGSAVQAVQGGNNADIDLCQNGTDKAFAIIRPGAGTTMYAISMTIATTTVTLGTEVAFTLTMGTAFAYGMGQSASRIGRLAQTTTDKVLVVYNETGGSASQRLIGVICSMSANVVTINTSTQAAVNLVGETEYSWNGCMSLVDLSQAGTLYGIFGIATGSATIGSCVKATVSSNTVTFKPVLQAKCNPVDSTAWGHVDVVGSNLLVYGDAQSTGQYYSVCPLTFTMELYNDGTIIGSAKTMYGMIYDLWDCDTLIGTAKAYIKMKLTSATTIYVRMVEALFEVS